MMEVVQYAIIIYKQWTVYIYGALVMTVGATYILFKKNHICEKLVYMIKYQ